MLYLIFVSGQWLEEEMLAGSTVFWLMRQDRKLGVTIANENLVEGFIE